MLYPQSNPFRQVLDLSGFWDFRFDPEKSGEAQGWNNGFKGGRPIAVPASWNDQFAGGRDNLGPAWYQTRFDPPWGWREKSIRLRFNSVNYLAEAWLNGKPLGAHEGGHLPFEFEISGRIKPEGNLLVVRVDGELASDRVPPGNITGGEADFFSSHSANFPQTQFDFFPFCGIQRPVLLYAVPHEALCDLTAVTEIDGTGGRVRVQAEAPAETVGTVRFLLRGNGEELSADARLTGGKAEAILTVPEAVPWSPASPFLYQLRAEIRQKDAVLDAYTLPVGIRTVSVEGDRLLLNGKTIRLKGFGRHEDFPVVGRGLLPPLVVKDYALMKWIGANSFRTSHYPYSEQMMDLADKLGFLVIDEIPAVGLFFSGPGLARRLALCRQYIRELIGRDKNHPAVVMWSVANEPHSDTADAAPFLRRLIADARELDPTRLVTLSSFLGEKEETFEACDVPGLNRYYGWYSHSGKVEEGVRALSEDLDAVHRKFGKPILLSEFGADAIAGTHAQPPEMFSEEYQAELISRHIEVVRAKPFVIGEHVWNLCDFKTAQGTMRAGGLNHKGVFTRDRRPKLAAHRLRELWG